MSRFCDRCEVKPATRSRGDFKFCPPCDAVVKGQEAINKASVHLNRLGDALQEAQTHLDDAKGQGK